MGNKELESLFEEKVKDFYEKLREEYGGNENISAILSTSVNSKIAIGAFGNCENIGLMIMELLAKDMKILDTVITKIVQSSPEAIEVLAIKAIEVKPQILSNILNRCRTKVVSIPATASPEEVTQLVKKHIEQVKIEREYGKTAGEA